MSSKWSSGVEEVKRIVQLLIPHASASFHARIYISFPLFRFLFLSSLSHSSRPDYFQHLREKDRLKKHTDIVE